MTNKGIDIKHPKLRGEWAELRFMARAAEHGLLVTKPWGDTARYDFAVEHKGKFLRVQVKSTMHRRGAGYSCNVVADGKPYENKDLDFLAAYVIPEDVWYIIPAEAFKGQTRVGLYPGAKDSKYYCYEEAWHLLTGKKGKNPASGPAGPDEEASAPTEDCPQLESQDTESETVQNDGPLSIVESRLRAIQSRLFSSPQWKPRR